MQRSPYEDIAASYVAVCVIDDRLYSAGVQHTGIVIRESTLKKMQRNVLKGYHMTLHTPQISQKATPTSPNVLLRVFH